MTTPKLKTDATTIHDLLTRGVIDVIQRKHLEERLKSGKPLTIKLGIDPTGPDLHLGHAVVMRKLRQFQNAGHKVTLIIGDWTARIGDPTDRNEMRPQLSADQIKKNAAKYLEQIFLILDKKKTKVVRHSVWFDKFTLQDVFNLVSKFTVAQLLNRDDFRKRQEIGLEIGYHEPIYSLLQAYDSVMVKADLELGATEQLFNILRGRDLQTIMGQEPQDVMTMKILVGLDGARKMGKSHDNYIALLDKPEEMYGRVMSIPDSLIIHYFELCTDVPNNELEAISQKLKAHVINPRDIKMTLARTIVTLYHSETQAKKAEAHFIKVFQKKETPDEIESLTLKPWPATLTELVVAAKLSQSMNEARRVIVDGGVKVDGKVINNPKAVVAPKPEGIIISRGKRLFKKVFKSY